MSLQRVHNLTPEQLRRRRRLTLEVLWVCTIALVPWAIYLGISLPHVYSTRHWDLAWSGFDGLEILALGATAYYGWRGRQALIATALAAATLLICDAWFDVSLDLGTPAIWTSLASAVFLELPLAFFLIHRVKLLLRITLMHLFPETDEKGRPMKLTKLPLLATLTEPFAAVRRIQGDGVPGAGPPPAVEPAPDSAREAAPGAGADSMPATPGEAGEQAVDELFERGRNSPDEDVR